MIFIIEAVNKLMQKNHKNHLSIKEHISGLNFELSSLGGSFTVMLFIKPRIPEDSLKGWEPVAISTLKD